MRGVTRRHGATFRASSSPEPRQLFGQETIAQQQVECRQTTTVLAVGSATRDYDAGSESPKPYSSCLTTNKGSENNKQTVRLISVHISRQFVLSRPDSEGNNSMTKSSTSRFSPSSRPQWVGIFFSLAFAIPALILWLSGHSAPDLCQGKGDIW